MKTIRVSYFAVLREERGVSEESVRTGAATAADLLAELTATKPFSLPQARLRVAINDAFASWSAPIGEGDRIALIPPVAGG